MTNEELGDIGRDTPALRSAGQPKGARHAGSSGFAPNAASDSSSARPPKAEPPKTVHLLDGAAAEW